MFSDFQRKKHSYFFQILDLNRNGVLELNDFSDMAEQVRVKLGLDLGSKEHKEIADKSTKFFYHFLEEISPKDPQGIIEKEWIEHFDQTLGGELDEEVLEESQELIFNYVFDFFDHNRDGFITKSEYEFFYEIFGADTGFLESSFQKLDKNGDGKISRYEMLASIEDFLISDDLDSPGNWTFGYWEAPPK